MHDKKIADTYPLHLPIGSVLRQDSGFIGHAPVGVLIEQTFKKPKKRTLSFSQPHRRSDPLQSTLGIGQSRYANSGIKRLRITKDIIRIHSSWWRDTVMVVACALHNFRVRSPLRKYPDRVMITKLS